MFSGLLTLLLASSFSPQPPAMARQHYFPTTFSSTPPFPTVSSPSRPRSDPIVRTRHRPAPRRTYYPVAPRRPPVVRRLPRPPPTIRAKPTTPPPAHPPDLRPLSNQELAGEDMATCPRTSSALACTVPPQGLPAPSPPSPPAPLSPGYTHFREAALVMLAPSLPQGTPFLPAATWSSPRPRHNISQTLADGEVAVGEDPHLESATVLRGARKPGRQGRIFSIFSLVRFKNSACTPTSGATSMGTCYLATQCSDKVGSRVVTWPCYHV